MALILPSITLGLFQMTLIMRIVRAEMLEVLRTDYIKFARARGLTTRAINFGHALKNTLVPVITIVGLQLGSVIAFSIITETVFQWPGMGLLFVQAVQNVDIPDHGRLPDARGADLRDHQPWRSTSSTRWSIRACGRASGNRPEGDADVRQPPTRIRCCIARQHPRGSRGFSMAMCGRASSAPG